MSVRPAVVHCIATLEGGGAERQLCYLSEHLTRKGWDVHALVLKGGVNLARLQASGARIHMIEAKSNYDLSIIFSIRRLLAEIDPQIVQCWQRPMDLYGAIAAVLAGRPFITVERTSPARYEFSLKGAARILIAQFSAAVVSNSIEGRDYWSRRLLRKLPNLIVPNIVPLEELSALRQHFVRDNCIVAVGRLSPEKNFSTVLEAARLVVLAGHKIKLRILGEGPERASLAQFIKRHGLEDTVELCGYRADVWSEVAAARIFISLSLYEGMPNAVLEAAALGTPMLLSDIPAHRFCLDDACATFADPVDAQRIAATLISMLNDPRGMQQKAGAALKAVENCTGAKVSDEYVRLYERLVGC